MGMMQDAMEELFTPLSRMLQKGLKYLTKFLFSPVVPPLSWPAPALFIQSDGNIMEKFLSSENGVT